MKPASSHNGWVAQRINPTKEHLPVLTIDVIKAQMMAEKMIGERVQSKKALNFDDMTVIRARVSLDDFSQSTTLHRRKSGIYFRELTYFLPQKASKKRENFRGNDQL